MLMRKRFTCQIYQPKTKITSLAEMRWSMFSKKQTNWEKLPPTRSSFVPAVKRVNYQMLIWNQDDKAVPNIPSPVGHGWSIENGQITPTYCDLPCAPDFILKLVRCACVKSRCSSTCKCSAYKLPCTEMCECGGSELLCFNQSNDKCSDPENDDSDGESHE